MVNFNNEKKTFLQKLDKSKRGGIDPRAEAILAVINGKNDYYTTSSCSGRVYLWCGTGKKNETEWVRVSHDLITSEFLQLTKAADTIWLRVEPLILHVACRDVVAATSFLQLAQKIYKKSCILTLSKKLIVEVRGSEFV